MRASFSVAALILLLVPRATLASELRLLDTRLSIAAADGLGVAPPGPGGAGPAPIAHWDAATTLVCFAAASAGVVLPALVIRSFALVGRGPAVTGSGALAGTVGLAGLVVLPPLAAHAVVRLWDLDNDFGKVLLANLLGLAVGSVPIALSGAHIPRRTAAFMTVAGLAVPALFTTVAAYLTNAPLRPAQPPPQPAARDVEEKSAERTGLTPNPFRVDEPPTVFTVQALAMRF